MWWMFEKKEDNKEFCIYAYSRESYELDGEIKVFKDLNDPEVLRSCRVDEGSTFCREKAGEKAYQLIRRNFPQRIQIACG